ncbi:MAG: hypothetical protein AAF488_01140 [Planctomycetota bacterium]
MIRQTDVSAGRRWRPLAAIVGLLALSLALTACQGDSQSAARTEPAPSTQLTKNSSADDDRARHDSTSPQAPEGLPGRAKPDGAPSVTLGSAFDLIATADAEPVDPPEEVATSSEGDDGGLGTIVAGLADVFGGDGSSTPDIEGASEDDGDEPDAQDIVSLAISLPATELLVGESSPLVALATLIDGTSVDVTDLVRWQLSNKHHFVIVEGSPAFLHAVKAGSVDLSARIGGAASSPVSLAAIDPPSFTGGEWLDTTPFNGLDENDTLFDGAIVDGVEVLRTTSGATNIHSHYVGSALDDAVGYELTGSLRVSNAAAGVGVTFFSDYPETDRYYRLRRYDGTDFHIEPHGTSITSGDTSTGVVPEPNVFYAFRVQVETVGNRTEIRARVWVRGEEEPNSWSIDCRDQSGNRLTDGTVGLWAMGPGEKFLGELAVDGESIELPEADVIAPTPTDIVQGDWYDTSAGNSLVVDPALFQVGRVGDELCLTTASDLTNIHSHFVNLDSPEWSNYSVTGRLRVDDAEAGVGVTVLSGFPLENSYYRLRRFGDGSFLIAPHGTSISGGTTTTTLVPTAGSWYSFRIEVEDTGTRTEIRAKVWPTGATEPTEFAIDCFDDSADRLTQGTVGFWSMGDGAKRFAGLRVDGQPVPLPQPTSLSVSADETTLALGETTPLTITAHYEDGSTVDVTGLAETEHGDRVSVLAGPPISVVGTETGSDTLVATFGSVSGGISFETTAPQVQSVSIAGSGGTLPLGATSQLNVFAQMSNGATQDVTADVDWQIADTAVLSIAGGSPALLTALGSGSTHVTAFFGGVASSPISIEVNAPTSLAGLWIDGPTAPLATGQTAPITVFAEYSDGSSLSVTDQVVWTTNTPMRVYVEPGDPATLTALFGGPTKLAASFQGQTAVFNLEVIGPPPLESIVLDAPDTSLDLGDSATFNVLAAFADGSTEPVTGSVTWSVSQSGVISVQNGSSLVTAVGVGSTSLTAHFQGQTSTVTVEVTAPTVTSVALSGPTGPLEVGQTVALSVVAQYSNGTTQDVTGTAQLALSNPGVANVAGGVLTALAAGTTSLTATVDGTTSNTVTVNVTEATLVGLTLAGPTDSLLVGEVSILSVMGEYSDGSNANLTADASYAFSQSGVATVSGHVLSAVGHGTTILTATVQGVTSNAVSVEVIEPTLDTLSLSVSGSTVVAGDSVQLTVMAQYTDGSVVDVTGQAAFNNGNPAVASIASGPIAVLTGESAGSTAVTASFEDHVTEVVVIEVIAAMTGLTLTGVSSSMETGDTASLTVSGVFSDGSTQNVTAQVEWVVDSASVLQVVGGGSALLTAVGAGTSEVFAELDGMTSNAILVTVEAPPQQDPPTDLPDVAMWIDTAPDSLSEDDSLFGVAIFGGQLVLETTSSSTNIHSHVILDNEFSSCEFTGKMMIDAANGGIGVTFMSQFPEADKYYRLRRYAGTDFTISPHGTSVSGDTSSGVTPQPGVWNRYRVQVTDTGSATVIKARVWNAAEGEPGNWQIDCQDTNATRLSSGTVGVWSMADGNKYWGEFEVDAQTIPLPQPFVLELQVTDSTLQVGETANVSLVCTDTGGAVDVTDLATFSLSNPSVLSVAGGTMAGLDPGACGVSASYQGYTTNEVMVSVFPEGGGGDGMAASITRNGITWQFDGLYPVGQFVTGDWWVVGPVTIISVSPTPSGGRHGSMLNPPCQTACGYDSRIPFYDSSLKVNYPLTMQPGDSLVSTESHLTSGSRNDLIGDVVSASHGHLKSAEVLTCVSEAVPPTFFRPPYMGTNRPLFDSSSIQWDLLPSLPTMPGSFSVPTSSSLTPCAQFARYFERPWIVHVRDWVGRQSHPTENMPNYHREVYNLIADASCLLISDHPDKEDLLIGFLQVGIDMYYATVTGSADSSSHKWVVIFTGLMLDHDGMKNTGFSYRTDWMTYYPAQGSSPFSSSSVPSNQGWTGANVLFRQDPGNAEHEHLHPTEWGMVPVSGGGKKREAYRRSNSFTWPGPCLAAILMGAQGHWDHPAFFEYVDRWMTEPDGENMSYVESLWSTSLYIGGQSTGSSFVKNMWLEYR